MTTDNSPENLLAPVLQACKEVLSRLERPVGTLHRADNGDPIEALVLERGGRVVRIAADGTEQQSTMAQLSLVQMALLLERPVVGKELQRDLKVLRFAQQEAARGQQLYQEMAQAIAANGFDYDASSAKLEAMDRDAAVAGRLVGRHVTQSVADGRAYYLVTAQQGGQVRLQHLHLYDGYSVANWGADAWESIEFVQSEIARRDAMSRLFSRRKAP